MNKGTDQAEIAPELVVVVEVLGSRYNFDQHFTFLFCKVLHLRINDHENYETEAGS